MTRYLLAEVAWVVLVLAGGAAARAADASVAATADTEGCVLAPASGSPAGALAARSTVVKKLREGPLLLVDGGNALFGEDAVASGGKVVAAAYRAMAYDALNISYRDFRLGKAHTLELIEGSGPPRGLRQPAR